MDIKSWLKSAEKKLQTQEISSARLDVEIILAEVLGANRSFLHAHPEKSISKQKIFHANNFVNKRAKRIPIAYVLGKKEFYGREFEVNPDVLVPRPESEQLINLYKKVVQDGDFILDIGTGSGILAISSWIEAKNVGLNVASFASDTSVEALKIAEQNASYHEVEINLLHSNLLTDIPNKILEQITIIIANLPYVDPKWIDQKCPNELHFEPEIALYAAENGLSLIKELISQTDHLPKLNHVIIEADPEQHVEIVKIAQEHNLDLIESSGYCLRLSRS